MLIRAYGDADTLRFVAGELDQHGAQLPKEAREGLANMLAEPAILYRLGRKDEALASVQNANNFASKAEMIRRLIAANDAHAAARVFELLSSTPPEFGEDCFGWFGPIGGLGLARLGNAFDPSPGLATFLDRIPASPLFKRICPSGLDAELAVDHLLAAGRLDAAIARARQEKKTPFLLIDALLQTSRVRLRSGDLNAARAHMVEAAAALPPFDRGDPIDPNEANRTTVDMSSSNNEQARRNFGERSGDTGRRFEVIRLLAATGAIAEAETLARRQPEGALRAVALSAAVAGRAGLRFDDQAPSLSSISSSDL